MVYVLVCFFVYSIVVGLVEYAVTSEFPRCGIDKVYQIKSNQIEY